ncbi:hypothetical protein EI94DRAFT_1753980 [Lactarius quietus]|nr:hypothetical protein EI94DRAFT_1753980 [Lactarius quietus]
MMQRFAFLLAASVVFLGTVVPTGFAMRFPREDQSQQENTGILQVNSGNGAILGWVFNDQAGPISLNFVTNLTPADKNLTVTYTNGNLLAQDPEFPRLYVGGNGTDILSPQNLNTIPFTDVSPGQFASIWTLDSATGLLNATWTNSDGTIVTPTLVINPVSGVLSFTANPAGVHNEQGLTAVTISLIQ